MIGKAEGGNEGKVESGKGWKKKSGNAETRKRLTKTGVLRS